MYRILLVEDDLENCAVIEGYLNRSGLYAVEIAHDANEALRMIGQRPFDMILLDIMLPDMDGIDLCTRLRRTLFCPIVFISCLDDEETIVRAYRMGGDDYLTKPFRGAMLEARIEAIRRRMQTQSAAYRAEYDIGGRKLDVQNHVLQSEGETICFSPTEFSLLLYFLQHEGQLLEYEQIYRDVWQKPSFGDLRTLFSHVRNLRKKIERTPAEPCHLITVPRNGYRFYAQGENA